MNAIDFDNIRLVLSHGGPGPHKDGSPQEVHGGDRHASPKSDPLKSKSRKSWKGAGTDKPYEVKGRPDELDDENREIYEAWLKKYPDADEFGDSFFARGQNTPDGVFFHASRDGLDPNVQVQPMNDIGRGLYVGSDPHALGSFYGILQGDEDTEVFAFQVDDDFDWLDLRDPNEMADWEETAKLFAEDQGYQGPALGYLASTLGHDGIIYFDPWATGEERAILNYDKVTQIGKARGVEPVLDW